MSHTYYTRLTIVHPNHASSLDPRRGKVVAETATTGRFIMGDVSWESAVAPNAETTVAYHTLGELKIYEPRGMGLFDYIKACAYELGIENHLDARYFLEIEVEFETMGTTGGSPYKYIWPIMIITTEVKGVFTEKGTEYGIKFVHTPYHAQTDIVQPIKDPVKVKAGTLKEYFSEFQNALEKLEFQYAAARLKASETTSGAKAPANTDNPGAKDAYHDEYHFILDPAIEEFKISNQRKAGADIQGAWFSNKYNITLRPGTTIIQQISKVLKSTEDIAKLLPGKTKPTEVSGTGSSPNNSDEELEKVYQFFRIETHSVYKSYDYIRGRYAVKHVFFIWLADQPNMYNYPDDLDKFNQLSNKSKVQKRLQYYIQEGLLSKLYYYNYTGLNTDILKLDLNFNYLYALPSFPVMWMNRGVVGAGAMGPENYNANTSPYAADDEYGVKTRELNKLRQQATEINSQLRQAEQNKKAYQSGKVETGDVPVYMAGANISKLQADLAKLQKEIKTREDELSTLKSPSTPLNTINNRSDLLSSLKDKYAEDIKFKTLIEKYINSDKVNLRPRMEIDSLTNQTQSENPQIEQELLMEKLFAVQVAPRDLIELELEIIGDPFWINSPNPLLQGKKWLDKIKFPAKSEAGIKERITERMSAIDKTWNERNPVWGDFGVAPQYRGAPLFYFLTQVPDSDLSDKDMLSFPDNDQIVGIYMVKKVVNDFKDGKWTQKLYAVRDLTIPSYILPRKTTGALTFEDFMQNVLESPERAKDTVDELRRREEAQRQAAAAGNRIQSTNPPPLTTSPAMQKAASIRNSLLDNSPESIVQVANPVSRAEQLLAGANGQPPMSRDEAYKQALKEHIDRLTERNIQLEAINKKAFEQAGITDFRPYSASTMSSLELQRSGNGGLNDWKNNNYSNPGPAIFNNPSGAGYDKATNSYYRYENYDTGIDAANNYYNYGQGVKTDNKASPERFMLPKDYTGNELEYLNKRIGTRRGG